MSTRWQNSLNNDIIIKHVDPRALGAFLFFTVLLGLFHLVGFKTLKLKKKPARMAN